MNILVTNPPWPGPGYGARSSVRWPHRRKDKYLEYPIYLAYLVSILKREGFETRFLDGVEEEMDIPSYVNAVRGMAPSLVFMETSTPSIEYDLESARGLKEALPDSRIVLLGPHVTYFHREILDANPAIDAVCRREFGETGRKIAAALSKGSDLSGIAGVSYRDGERVHANADKDDIDDIDSFPYPDREAIPIEKYRQGSFLGKKTATLISSTGCPFKCIYCLWPKTLYFNKRRERSPESVVREMEDVVHRFGADEIYFDDDSMFISRKRLFELGKAEADSPTRVNWIGQARVDVLDEESTSLLKKAGCHYLRIGIESGSKRMLELMRKNTDLESCRRAVRLCRRAGIKTQAFFIFGVPGENRQSIRETIDFAKRLDPDSAQFSIIVPYPGTDVYETARANGWLKYDTWEDFAAGRCLMETPDLPAREVDSARARAYREFYLRPSYMIKTLLRVRRLSDIRSIIKGAKSIIVRLFFFNKY